VRDCVVRIVERGFAVLRSGSLRALSDIIFIALSLYLSVMYSIGHGFGLPHTDERFWNRDQGNCMDYTNRPQNNMQPDSVNFETLASVYGEIGGTKPPVVSTDELEPASFPPTNNQPRSPPFQPIQEKKEEEEEEEEEKDNEDDRRLRSNLEDDADAGGFPSFVRRRMVEIDDLVFGDLQAAHSGWRVLHETEHGRALEMDLGKGFKVQLHFLLATEADHGTHV